MSARDDYPKLASKAANPAIWFSGPQCAAALDEIDRLRAAQPTDVLVGDTAVEIADFIDPPDFVLDPSRNVSTINMVEEIIRRNLGLPELEWNERRR